MKKMYQELILLYAELEVKGWWQKTWARELGVCGKIR